MITIVPSALVFFKLIMSMQHVAIRTIHPLNKYLKQTTRYIYTHSTVNYTQISVFVKLEMKQIRIWLKIRIFRKGYDPQLKWDVLKEIWIWKNPKISKIEGMRHYWKKKFNNFYLGATCNKITVILIWEYLFYFSKLVRIKKNSNWLFISWLMLCQNKSVVPKSVPNIMLNCPLEHVEVTNYSLKPVPFLFTFSYGQNSRSNSLCFLS